MGIWLVGMPKVSMHPPGLAYRPVLRQMLRVHRYHPQKKAGGNKDCIGSGGNLDRDGLWGVNQALTLDTSLMPISGLSGACCCCC